jgi:hypothetical protein
MLSKDNVIDPTSTKQRSTVVIVDYHGLTLYMVPEAWRQFLTRKEQGFLDFGQT